MYCCWMSCSGHRTHIQILKLCNRWNLEAGWSCTPRLMKDFFGSSRRSLGTTPISGKTLSEGRGHSRSSRRVPGYSRSNSRNSKFRSRNTKFHAPNGIPRLEQYENQNSRSNSRSDSRNWWEPTCKIFICPGILGAFFQELGWSPRTRFSGWHLWTPKCHVFTESVRSTKPISALYEVHLADFLTCVFFCDTWRSTAMRDRPSVQYSACASTDAENSMSSQLLFGRDLTV